MSMRESDKDAELRVCDQPNCQQHGKSPCKGVGCDGMDDEERSLRASRVGEQPTPDGVATGTVLLKGTEEWHEIDLKQMLDNEYARGRRAAGSTVPTPDDTATIERIRELCNTLGRQDGTVYVSDIFTIIGGSWAEWPYVGMLAAAVGGDLPKPDRDPQVEAMTADPEAYFAKVREDAKAEAKRYVAEQLHPGLPEQPQPDLCGPACEANHEHRQP